MDTRAWFAIIALGQDRPGIVADLSGCIFDCGYNLEDTSMTQLGDEFAVLMLISGRDSKRQNSHGSLHDAVKRLEWEKHLTVFVRRLEGEPEPRVAAHTETYTIKATGIDRGGIVAGVSGCLADAGVDIADLRGGVSEAPQSGTPVYTLRIRATARAGVNIEALNQELDGVGRRLDVEVSLERQDG